ncbi:hypothetical protein IPA_01115 [Ignicoccus pacificus DSM 13166]|uniref:Uncharacterized protein n=1 Tax=Ignicoccus pacificus DSM 13166 TaxID=940294 RepID=A0A977KAJ3_9CREN|nr:hypothetical protein IPA_01115 [Ignicoccus pacificus DSM 13166]
MALLKVGGNEMEIEVVKLGRKTLAVTKEGEVIGEVELKDGRVFLKAINPMASLLA